MNYTFLAAERARRTGPGEQELQIGEGQGYNQDMINDKRQIIKLLTENKRAFHDFGARRVGLFGSFARNQQSAASDVDLMVNFLPERKTYRNLLGVADLAEKLLDRKVEVLTPESVSPYLAPYIEKDVIYVKTG